MKSPLSTLMTASDVVVDIRATSNLFEYVSTTTRNILPWNGPVKSIWILGQGTFGFSQTLPQATGSAGLDLWHAQQEPTQV